MAEAPDIRVRLVPEGVDLVLGALRKVSKEAALLVGAVGAAAGAITAMAKQTANLLDELGKMSQKVGVSVESLSALKYAAQLSDVSLDTLSSGLRFLSKNMVEAQAGTGEAKDAFRALGINVAESGGKLKLTEEVLLQVADKFSKTRDSAEKTAFAMKIFGKSGAELIPLLNSGRAGIEEMRKEAERLGVVFSTEAAKAAELFNDNLTRLQNTGTGLAVHMAGPFVRAFGEATTAMLEAQKQGESFFRTISQGLNQLIFGGDAQRWSREMAEAGETLLQAQDKLDKAMRSQRLGGTGRFAQANVDRAKAEVAAAQAEIARLAAIKPILAPEAAAPAAGPTETLPGLEAENKAEQDLITKQNQWAAEEEIRVQSEIAQLTNDFRVREREQEAAAENERIRILIEAYDREQEEAIAHGQVMLEILKNTTDEEIKISQMGVRRRAATIAGGFAEMTSAVSRGSRAMFNINKIAGIANVALTLPEKISDAYKWGTKIGGPYVGAAFAAVAGAAGLAHIQMMRSQSFDGGGGGVAPSASATPAPPVSPVGGVGGGAGTAQTTVVQFSGTTSEQKLLRQFVDMLNENQRDGGRIILA